MEFSAILAGVYDETNNTSPVTATVTRVKRFVNEGLRLMLSEPGLQRLADSDGPYTFASVASQARYVLPDAVARIHHIHEATNDITLAAMDLGRYRHADPDPASSSGTPTHYAPIGRVAVAVQPSDASVLYVKSTSASDIGDCNVEGILAGGTVRLASATMTGTTAVAIGITGSNAFAQVTDLYLSATAVGTVTLHEDSGVGTELATIAVGQKRPRYYGIYLWPTPSAVVTYSVDYRREIVDLVNDTDEPPIPTDLHPALVAYAVAREKEKTQDVEGSLQAMARYTKFLKHLKYQTQTLSDEIPVVGRGGLVGRSRLGAWFPADFYTRG